MNFLWKVILMLKLLGDFFGHFYDDGVWVVRHMGVLFDLGISMVKR